MSDCITIEDKSGEYFLLNLYTKYVERLEKEDKNDLIKWLSKFLVFLEMAESKYPNILTDMEKIEKSLVEQYNNIQNKYNN